MGRRQRDAQHRLATRKQHHHTGGAGLAGKIFGMPGERHAGIVDHTLVHRRRHHRSEFARNTAGQRGVERRQHVGGVGRVEMASAHSRAQRYMADFDSGQHRRIQPEPARTRFEQRGVADQHQTGAAPNAFRRR